MQYATQDVITALVVGLVVGLVMGAVALSSFTGGRARRDLAIERRRLKRAHRILDELVPGLEPGTAVVDAAALERLGLELRAAQAEIAQVLDPPYSAAGGSYGVRPALELVEGSDAR